MSQQIINTGADANDGTGEPLREAFTAVNDNFTERYTAGPVGRNEVISTGGYWKQAEGARKSTTPWSFVPVNLGEACADMVVLDLDGDEEERRRGARGTVGRRASEALSRAQGDSAALDEAQARGGSSGAQRQPSGARGREG